MDIGLPRDWEHPLGPAIHLCSRSHETCSFTVHGICSARHEAIQRSTVWLLNLCEQHDMLDSIISPSRCGGAIR